MKKIIFLLLIILSSCNSKTKKDCTPSEYCFFYQTPVERIAKLLEESDFQGLKQELKDKKYNINYAEPEFGLTLLMTSVSNRDYEGTKLLLEHGANPNQHDTYDGGSPIIIAAGLENFPEESTQFLKLILEHGGNPNDEETGQRQEGNTTRKNPLNSASSDVHDQVSPLKKVKLLVEAGANINYINEFGEFALKKALLSEHFDVVLYLLNKGAKHDMVIVDRSEFQKDGKKIYIMDFLLEQDLTEGSLNEKQRNKVIEFLKNKK